jgi:hypothetical protein
MKGGGKIRHVKDRLSLRQTKGRGRLIWTKGSESIRHTKDGGSVEEG